MEESAIEIIKQKTTKGIVFLSFRNLSVQAISIAGFFILSLLLDPGEIGLFAVVAETIGILAYFSDVGLASALVQQKKEVNPKDLQTAFTVQQFLVITSLIILAIFYPQISHSRNYGQKELWIVFSLCFAFFTGSLKTIPTVLLERKLNFKLLSIIDIIENCLFYIIAVIFALMGFQSLSYAYAIFIRSSIGLILIYLYSPWNLGLSFSLASAKKLFKFGIPFQLNSFIAVAKDRLSSVLVAGIIGRESFGLLSWAQKGPRVPLSLMDAIMKVTFPTFSRLQDHPDILKRSLEKSSYFIALLVFPALAGISLIAPDFISIIPKYHKWYPAVFPLYLFSINAALAAITTPITNAFNAIGKITLTTKFMIMWTILTWIFYPLLSYRLGYQGTALATLLVGSSSIIVWFFAKRHFNVNIYSTLYHPVISTLVMIAAVLPISLLSISSSSSLVLKITIGSIVYCTYHYFFSQEKIRWFYLQFRKIK